MNRQIFGILIILAIAISMCQSDKSKTKINSASMYDVTKVSNSMQIELLGGSTQASQRIPVNIINSGELAKAIEVRKAFILPILNGILSSALQCEELLDNDQSYKAIEAIRTANERADLNRFCDQACQEMLDNEKYGPAIETQLQQKMQGHIIYGFPNAATVEELARIHQKYPCSEAALIALSDITNVIYQPDPLYFQLGSFPIKGYDDKLLDFIISNYPESWEVEAASFSKNMKNLDRFSAEAIELIEKSIDYREKHNVAENRYFVLISQNGDPSNTMAQQYLRLANSYLGLALKTGRKDIKEKNRLSSAAVDGCKKAFEVFDSAKKKYPNSKDLFYSYNKQYNTNLPGLVGFETCYKMTNRIDEYKGK